MALTFEQALPGLLAQQTAQTGTSNIMDALAAYNQAQQQSFFAPPPAPVVSTSAAAAPITPTVGVAPPPPSGIAALSAVPPAYDAAKVPTIASLYQQVLGRTPDIGGLQYWEKEIGGGGISPEEYQKFIDVAKPELDVQSLYRQYLGRGADPGGLEYWKDKIASEGISPEEREMFYKAAAPEMVTSAYRDILGRGLGATDPGLAYYTQQIQSGALKPQDFIPTFIRGATGADIVPAQQFSIIGSQNYLSDFEKYRPSIEKTYGLDPNALKSDISPAALADKNLQQIQETIRGSGANRYQEAIGVADFAKELYGLNDDQRKQLVGSLLKGNEQNSAILDYYNQLVKQDVKPETLRNLINDVAKKKPDSPYFAENPRALTLATPVGEIKRGEETSYTYGADPVTGLPTFHRQAWDNALGKEVILSGAEDYTNSIKHQYVGADPHSRYQGVLARGTGVFGVKANADEVADFARIQKVIDELGGTQKYTDPEGNQFDVVYVSEKDPESGNMVQRMVPVEQLFATKTGEFDAYDGFDRYNLYKQTKDRLADIAVKQVYKDPTKVPEYKDIKEAYEDLNDKTKDLYYWQGRTDTLDPEVIKKLGIEDPKDNAQHIGFYARAQGDRIFPITEKKEIDGKTVDVPIFREFKFSDPNTTSGFFGDIIGGLMEILSVPPISMALSAGLFGAGGALSGVSQSLGQSVITNLGLDAALANSSLSYAQMAALESAIGNSLLNSGINALLAGGQTKDIDEAGRAFLASLAGSGISSISPILTDIDPRAARLLGTTAAAGIADRDIGQALTGDIQSMGISSLIDSFGKGEGQQGKIMSALAPAILRGEITPSDVLRLTQAINPPQVPAR